MTEAIFFISLFGFVYLFTLYMLYYFVPKFHFNYRLKTFSAKPMKNKGQHKEGQHSDKKWLRYIVQKIEEPLLRTKLPITVKEFVTFIFCGNIVGIVLFIFLPAVGLILIFSINVSFFLLIKVLEKRRRKQMVEQLPDVLQLISNALKAGYSFVQTIDLVGQENFGPLSEEFSQLYQALNLGEPFETALVKFEKRLSIDEITTMVDTLLITRETGGNVTVVIDSLLLTMRENERLLGSLKAITAQGRMSAWVVGTLPLGLFIILYLLNPDYMQLLFTHPVGITITTTAFILQVIGIFILTRMVKLKVR